MEIHRPTSGDATIPHFTPSSVPTTSDKIQSPRLDLEDLYCILQIQPNDSFMAMELAKRLTLNGRLDEAARVLQSVLKIDYRFETVHALAQVEYQLDHIEESFALLQESISIAPEESAEFFELFKTLGNIFVRRGDLESAEDNYNKAHRLQPQSDVLQVNLGTLYIQRQMWDEAAEHFRKGLSLKMSNDKAWIGLAICHRMKGDHELSWGNVEAALEYNPLNEVALGLALDWGSQEGREFRVLEMIRQFLVEGGWSERMSLAFCWLSWKRGDTELAILELERLLAVNPENETALKLVNDIRKSA